jgi:GT2 family glycosyltransferase
VSGADRVVIAYIHPGDVRGEFCRSLVGTVRAMGEQVEAVRSFVSGPLLSRARNLVVSTFLAGHTSPWLWLVDADMVWRRDALRRLVEAADPAARPVLGGLYFGLGPDGPVPMMHDLVELDGQVGFAVRQAWPEGDVVEVDGTGTGCLLVHRDVLLRMAEGGDEAYPWFRESALGKLAVGEDLTFCLRARQLGLPVHVHTGVQFGHVKTQMLGKPS